jgi:hypothetical protein
MRQIRKSARATRHLPYPQEQTRSAGPISPKVPEADISRLGALGCGPAPPYFRTIFLADASSEAAGEIAKVSQAPSLWPVLGRELLMSLHVDIFLHIANWKESRLVAA